MGRVFESLDPVDVSGDAFTRPLPLGPDGVLHGTLENGMTYYVRHCAKPKGRAALALAVRVGSVAEEEQERGIAHIVEHLAFNATDNYSNHDIVKLLERIGAEFGACQNAYTSSDETVYTLTVPCDRGPGLVDETLAVMAEWAFRIRCGPGDLAKERGAVLEEWRMARDAQGRMQEAHWELMLKGSRYAERLPIGTEAVIRRCPASTVAAFYERWYQPQHMAIVAVGDFEDTGAIVASIQRHLGSGSSRSQQPPPPLPSFAFKPHDQPRCKVFVDRETQHSSVYVSFKHPRTHIATPEQFLQHLVRSTFEFAFNNRLYKISRQQKPPFASASISDEPLCAAASSGVLSAVAIEEGVLPALESMLTEMARVRLHGFSESEINRAILDLQSDIENTFLEASQAYCDDVRDEYVRHFLNNEFVTGQEFEARLSKSLLPLLSKSDVEAVAARYHPRASCVVKVVQHKRCTTEEQVKQVLERVAAAEAANSIGPWEEPPGPESLMASEPTPGTVVSERHFEALDVTEFTLSNGMRVAFKTTAHMRDEVHLSGFAFGGLSEVPRELFYSSSLAGTLAGQLGVFGHKPEQLGDMLAGRRVALDIHEGAYTRTVQGVQSPLDLETAFQLLHLLFTTTVEMDAAEVDVAMRLVRQGIEAQLRNPLHRYHERVRLVNYGGCYYFEPITLQEFEKVNPAMALAHHNLNWRNPAEFTLVLTGNVTRELLEPLACRYLASVPVTALPPPRPATSITPLPFSFPQQPVVEDVQVPMVSPLCQVQLTFPVALPVASAREELMWLTMACRALETRLLQRLRFAAGEVYTVSVGPFFGCEAPSNEGDPRGDVSLAFTCDPANKAKLTGLALAEVALLQEELLPAAEVQTLVHLEQLRFENSQTENSYWHDTVVMGYQSKSYRRLGNDLGEVHTRSLEARERVLAAMSPETLREAMRRLLPHPPTRRYTAITMMPQPPNLLQRAAAAVAGAVSWLLPGCGCGGRAPGAPRGLGEPELGPPGGGMGEVAALAGAGSAREGELDRQVSSEWAGGVGGASAAALPATAAAVAVLAVAAAGVVWYVSRRRSA